MSKSLGPARANPEPSDSSQEEEEPRHLNAAPNFLSIPAELLSSSPSSSSEDFEIPPPSHTAAGQQKVSFAMDKRQFAEAVQSSLESIKDKKITFKQSSSYSDMDQKSSSETE